MSSTNAGLNAMRDYFRTGITQPVSFRKLQLQKLKNAILQYESDINTALYKDLGKNIEEIWLTETGMVISEINYFLKHIDELVAPQNVSTNLLNQPGKSYIHQDPLGVVLIIAPWNYPLQLCFMPLVGAIAAGNCVVLKPSEFAPETEKIMERIIREVFEMRFVNYITGDGATVIPDLVNTFRFDHIFFTGGTKVGKSIYEMAARQLVPVTLELGGKNPCVITPNANLKIAAKKIALAKFSNTGQMCITADYLLIHESIKENFLNVFIETIKNFYGQHAVNSYDYGRIINKKHFNRLMGHLNDAKILYGGTHNEDLLFIEPTIIDNPSLNNSLMQEEIFGPLLPVLTYKNIDDALQVIQQNPDPLAFYIFTNDNKEAQIWLQHVPSGGACVNAVALHYLNKNLPFGGRGNSGIGMYHGKFSFETFSHKKAVLKAATWPDLPIVYPSFKGKIGLLKKIMK